MASPEDPDQKKKYKATPKYHLADSDDEDEDTVETRKSVKTVEKRDKHRFFINAKEARQYHKDVEDGNIEAKQMNFEEDSDDELGPRPTGQAAKRAAKAAATVEEHKKKVEESKKSSKQKKAEAKEAAVAEKIAKSKEADAIETTPAKVDSAAKDAAVTEADDEKYEANKAAVKPDLPPELAGAVGAVAPAPAGNDKAAFMQAYSRGQDSDSDSSDSDSDSD